MKKIVFALILGVFVMSSCSVFMAANKSGTSVDEISQCKTRTAIIAKGAESIKMEQNEEGNLVEYYKVQKPKGSTSRAVMHGLLDVATIGLWEVAGTPMEGAMGKKKYYGIRVTFDENENVKKMEVLP